MVVSDPTSVKSLLLKVVEIVHALSTNSAKSDISPNMIKDEKPQTQGFLNRLYRSSRAVFKPPELLDANDVASLKKQVTSSTSASALIVSSLLSNCH